MKLKMLSAILAMATLLSAASLTAGAATYDDVSLSSPTPLGAAPLKAFRVQVEYTPMRHYPAIYLIQTETPEAERMALDKANEVYEKAGAVRLSDASNLYNCHSYAFWERQAMVNNLWLNMPEPYLEDGCYMEIPTAEPGCIVEFYCAYLKDENGFDVRDSAGRRIPDPEAPAANQEPIHSGWVLKADRSIPENGTVGNLNQVTMISKWGMGGMYQHAGDNCPYVMRGGVQQVKYFRVVSKAYSELPMQYDTKPVTPVRPMSLHSLSRADFFGTISLLSETREMPTEPAGMKNGLYTDADGEIRFYSHGQACYAGLVQDTEGNFYYIGHARKAVRNSKGYTFSAFRSNGLLPAGHAYSIDAAGHLGGLPTVLETYPIDPSVGGTPYGNGMFTFGDGTVYSYRYGLPDAGVIVDQNGDYRYASTDGSLVCGRVYDISAQRGRGLLPQGTYEFDAEGRILHLPEKMDASDPSDLCNGLVRMPDGTIRYMENGVPQHKGLVKDKDGHFLYINSYLKAVTNTWYGVSLLYNNNLLPNGYYYFDRYGYMAVTKVPAYLRNATDSAISRIKDIQSTVQNGFSLAWITDTHVCAESYDTIGHGYWADQIPYSTNVYHSGSLASEVMDACGIPFLLNTGDSIRASVEEYPGPESVLADALWEKEILAPVPLYRQLRCLGNHDGFWGKVGNATFAHAMTQEEKVRLWMDPLDQAYRTAKLSDDPTTWGPLQVTWGSNHTYYFVDDPVNKVRHIMLNSCNEEYTVDANHRPVKDGVIYSAFRTLTYGTEQLEWLANTALNMEEGWTATVTMHVPPVDGMYGSVDGETPAVRINQAKDQYLLVGILRAFVNRTTYTHEAKRNIDSNIDRNLYISVDFTKAKGDVAAVLAGHCHFDLIDEKTIPGIPIITLCSASASPKDETGKHYTPAVHTPEESCMDFVVVDTDTHMIYLTRLGSGVDRRVSYGQ